MAFRSPFSATINALLPEASSSKRAEQPRRKAYSHATTKDKEIRAGNRERGKPLKIQYIIGCVEEDGAHSANFDEKVHKPQS